MIQWDPIMKLKTTLSLALIATFLFSLMAISSQFSFLADDYIFLSRSFNLSFNLQDFGVIYARRPLTAFVNYGLLKLGLFDHLKLLFCIFPNAFNAIRVNFEIFVNNIRINKIVTMIDSIMILAIFVNIIIRLPVVMIIEPGFKCLFILANKVLACLRFKSLP